MVTTTSPAENENFDQVLIELRRVVEKLESGNLSLEQSLAVFEEGVRLSRAGARILDAAETRIEILLKDPETQTVTRAPFEAEKI